MSNSTPSFLEDHISQIPALQLLQNLGYTYLTPAKALKARGNKASNVLLEDVLIKQLRKINTIQFKGKEHPFTEGNVVSAIQSLKEISPDGLTRANEVMYDLLCLGRTLQQTIDGDTKSHPFHFIDWNDWSNNVFHVTEEFEVEKTGSHDKRRPDIVLFVNGIPLVVIECKRPDLKDAIENAILQLRTYQNADEIPKLFAYSQLLLSVATNEAKYGTVRTPLKFWSVWQEKEDQQKQLQKLVNKKLSAAKKKLLFATRPESVQKYFDELEAEPRLVTEQDQTIHSLCQPQRLLELIFRYTVFDAGVRKVARYQQYFCVRKILKRVRLVLSDGTRNGGLVWHTQGSGKSLTMVMLAEALALEPDLDNFKIILVTDRVDLDDQLYKTFSHCGTEPVQAKTGKHLGELIDSPKSQIITTVIDKFEAAVSTSSKQTDNPNIFVLVDEAHRAQSGKNKKEPYSELHAKMRTVLKKACFIGFTGTPLVKKTKKKRTKGGADLVREGSTSRTFLELIDQYTIREAVADKAVVPLLYEGRHVKQTVDSEPIDAWFKRVTAELSEDQRFDLKKKFARTNPINNSEQTVKRIAWDISVHFSKTWGDTAHKAQLVAPNKATALLYKQYLDDFEMVTSEVLMSGPDDRKDNEDVGPNLKAVQAYWKKTVGRTGRFPSEKEYNRQIINSFKKADHPEILIVVSKLLTGFDAPRNTVLYLAKSLTGHTLLQAIARVNRLFDGKDFGYIIDYYGVLEDLDNALDVYGKFSDLDDEGLDDLAATLVDVSDEIKKLPQRHANLWGVFKTLKNKKDIEAYEVLLGDEEKREQFYERLLTFSKTLAIALSSVSFHEATPRDTVKQYKKDLKFFSNLRSSVRRRYNESVDFKEYETKIKKLIDTHVGAGEVEQITELVNIFDVEKFAEEVDKLGSTASKADTIAHRVKKTIEEEMQKDPEFYKPFSDMIEDVIKQHRLGRLAAADALKKSTDILNKVRNRTGDDTPAKLDNNDIAKAFYGATLKIIEPYFDDQLGAKDVSATVGLRIDEIIRDQKIVNWVNNSDVQNRMKGTIEDYLFEVKEEHQFDLTFEDIDKVLELTMDIARLRHAG